MPDDPSNSSDPRVETGSRARELPQDAHIKKRFEKFQDFVDLYRSRISLGGAFIDVDLLRPVGSEVYLDFRLEDGYRLLHGLAEVVWVRLKTMSEERPKGIGIRFLSLDESGRELVLKLLEEQVKSGGAPFEVDRVPEDGSIDPTVVQALAGPSAEENEAAQKAKTGSRDAQEPESESPGADGGEDDEELPDLPPGVLPPPDEEPDFSAPWGEQLPEIPTELLEESSSAPSAGSDASPSIPAVEAPESPYAPGSDTHDEEEDDAAPVPEEDGQADFAFDPPSDGGDPHLDETDFGASAWSTEDEETTPPDVKPVGGTTSLQEARDGSDPFGDLDGESAPEVDGTLFHLPDTSPPAAAETAESSTAPGQDEATSAADESSFDEPTFESPSFDAESFADAPSFEAPSFDDAAPDAGGSFDGGSFDGGSFDVDFGDDSASQVAPPPDIGDRAGSAWEGDVEPSEQEVTEQADDGAAASSPEGREPTAESAAPPEPETPKPSPEEEAAMDAAMDLGDDDFAFDPPDSDLIDAPGIEDEFEDSVDDSRSDIATPESVAAAALAEQMDDEPGSQFETQPTPSPEPASGKASSGKSTETADDLFAFRGPPDAQPALDPEETASLRKGALPDLSDTMMGTKSPQAAEGGGDDLHHSYDDWEEWAPHPAGAGSRLKKVLGVVLLLALVGGASYYFRSTLLPMVGLGADDAPAASLGPPEGAPNAAAGDPGVEEYAAPDDPLAEPVEVAEPDPGTAGTGDDEAEAQTRPQTVASAESLRPSSTREEATSEPTAPPSTAPPPPTAPPAVATSQTSTSRPNTGAASGRSAGRVLGIDVQPGAGGTDVVIRLDGGIDAGRFVHDPLAWAPDKEMVTLRGFENFEQPQISGRGSHLRQIRVGFHPGKELRLVFDLASDGVSIQSVRPDGDRLVIRLAG